MNNEDLNLKLELASDFYKEIDNGCKTIETKAQNIFYITLFLLFANLIMFMALSATFNGSIITTITLIFISIISVLLSIASFYANKAANMAVYYVLGKSDIVIDNDNDINYKEKIISLLLDSAYKNRKEKWKKRDNLNEAIINIKTIICLIPIYIIIASVVLIFI